MDEMRCILYAHGGMDLSLPFPVVLKCRNPKAAITLVVWIRRGLFFLNTPRTISLTPLTVLRYSMQRFARKISGRVLGEHENISDLNVLIPLI